MLLLLLLLLLLLQRGVQLARRLQQEEVDRLAMDLAVERERARQIHEARFPATAPVAAAPAAAAAGEAGGDYYAQAPSNGDILGEDK